MAILTNSFDGSDAVTLTGSNTDDEGDAFTVTLNGGDIEYDTAQYLHGTASALFLPLSGIVTELQWNATAATTAMASFHIRIPAVPAGTGSPTICQVRNASAAAAGLQVLHTTPKFRVLQSGGNTLFTSATITAGVWYRVELRVIRGTTSSDGTIQFAYYLGDSLTPVETAYSSTAVNAGTTDLTNVRFGRCSSATGVTDTAGYWIDSAQFLTGADADELGKPWLLEQIPLTTTRVSDTAVNVAWTHPSDAPAGVSIIRSTGTQVNDGLGNEPTESDYDPTTLSSDVTVANGLDGGDTPYADTGLTPGVYTYWVVRTSP
jgi:hypothetical protein